jgi:hypothetical protein
MFNTIVGAGAVGAGAASRYGSGSGQKMRLLAAPQHCKQLTLNCKVNEAEKNQAVLLSGVGTKSTYEAHYLVMDWYGR